MELYVLVPFPNALLFRDIENRNVTQLKPAAARA